MNHDEIKKQLANGDTFLGIELGSTRIKAVLIGSDYTSIASGEHAWENRFENEIWTYHIEDVWTGLQDAYAKLASEVGKRYGMPLTRIAAIGFSAMMHGYLPLDQNDNLLTPFRTWRNTTTGRAADVLTERFSFNIPQRWSIAHLYQAVLNDEPHVGKISYLTTLAGYVHYKLTGKKVLGVGEASGMFPIDSTICHYNNDMLDSFDALVSDHRYPWKIRDILPHVLPAGADAGVLSADGARLLDPTGALQSGIPLAPPEGDAGTGMVATNSVAQRTGNISAGTSVFAMIVLEQMLSRVYPEIDMVTTPTGAPVAMVHCNNCTNEINAWATVFREFLSALGQAPDMNQIYTAMFSSALEGDVDGGGLLLYNYLSGEPITGFDEGRPLLVRTPDAALTFPNFMRTQLYSALATLKIGLDILSAEHVSVDRLMGHGGYFKTPEVGQKIMSAAANTPVSVMETASEGGPWGMALLAAFLVQRKEGQSLESYLSDCAFSNQQATTVTPAADDVTGFDRFMERYRNGLPVQRAAIQAF